MYTSGSVIAKRNSFIELLRFLCASVIIFGHIANDCHINTVFFSFGDLEISFFPNSNYCVEFFFLVSGFFLASFCYQKIEQEASSSMKDISEETIAYIWRRVKKIFPYHLVACILVAIANYCHGIELSVLLWRLPSLLFLQRTGIAPDYYLSVAWYISSMLIAMAIIYPLCRRYYYQFTMIIAPVGALLILGAIIVNTGTLGHVKDWSMITYKTNFRALAEIALGTSCFEIYRRIKDVDLANRTRTLLSIASGLSIVVIVIFLVSNLPTEKGGIIVLLIGFVITIALSQVGVLGKSDLLYNNKLFNYLGAIGMPMFLIQNLFRSLAGSPFGFLPKSGKILFIYFGTILGAVIMRAAIERLRRSH